jgi:site-specific DNA-methyltransferase (adenine-specific)
MNSTLMFSKASDEWSTPQEFYDALHAEFGFQIDAAATRETNKCAAYYGLDRGGLSSRPCYGDALAGNWFGGPHWCNPPYSKCREFVAKAAQERVRGVLTVMLVPSRTDTRWFHEHVWDAQTHRPRLSIEVRFVKGRLKFGGAAAGAPFPSMVIVFRP